MQQIAPDAPLKAHAGQLAVLPGGDKVASLILRGEALLDSKEGKQKWPMPADKNFTEAFIDIAGDAYQARPNDLQPDLSARSDARRVGKQGVWSCRFLVATSHKKK